MSRELREHMLNMIQSEGDFSDEELQELHFLSWVEIADRDRIGRLERMMESQQAKYETREEL